MWKYEKGEHRKKHLWSKPEAGFTGSDRSLVGKCPCNVLPEEANELLKRGIPSGFSPEGWPDRIYAVLRGVVYEAVPTIKGVSYHAYPWRFLPNRNYLPKLVLNELHKQAQTEGTEKQFKKWIKEYGQ